MNGDRYGFNECEFMEEIYDIVRFVNPLTKVSHNIYVDEVFQRAESQNTCYEIWECNKVCENCTSMRSFLDQKVNMKLKYSNEHLFLVVSVPTKDGSGIIELGRDVTNDEFFSNFENASKLENYEKLQQLNSAVVTDPLTGLYNRRYLTEHMPFEVAQAFENKMPFGVVMADIDKFKKLNDKYGHLVGDKILEEVAGILKANIRDSQDWIVRYGGEEFVVFLGKIAQQQLINKIESIRLTVEEHLFIVGDKEIQITMSFGISSIEVFNDAVERDWERLIAQSDEALYHAKRLGRNRCRLFGDYKAT